MGIDIGTEVHPNTLVTIYVITVSVNHDRIEELGFEERIW